jgi:hypothetical protein
MSKLGPRFIAKGKPHNIGTFFIFSFSSLQLYIICLVDHMAFKFGGEWDTMGANVISPVYIEI